MSPWVVVGLITVVLAAVCAPLGFRRQWHPALMAGGTVATAVLLSTSIVAVFGTQTLHRFLLVLFPIHALGFAAVGYRRREPRYLLTISIFLALTGVMWIHVQRLDRPRLRAGLRAVAVGCTLASLGLLVWRRRQRSDPNPHPS